jgi:V/A-type H+-transporting ATPase subunit A
LQPAGSRPPYLSSRLSEFYGRAGRALSLNGKTGSVSVIGAVSPQGGDFSEPVTQNTKRFVRCFWGLDRSLAYARHYPAIHWLTSYSEYGEDLEKWYIEHLDKEFIERRERIMLLLRQEEELMEIVKLVGMDVLPEDQKLVLEISRVIRVGFLQQNAFHKVDTYVPLEKQSAMMGVILFLLDKVGELVKNGIPLSAISAKGFFEECVQMKYTVPNDDLSVIRDMQKRFDDELRMMLREYNAHRVGN